MVLSARSWLLGARGWLMLGAWRGWLVVLGCREGCRVLLRCGKRCVVGCRYRSCLLLLTCCDGKCIVHTFLELSCPRLRLL